MSWELDDLRHRRQPTVPTCDVYSPRRQRSALHTVKYLGLLVLNISKNLVFSGKVWYGSVIIMYWELGAITLPLCYSVVSRSWVLQDSARMCYGRICCRCYRSGHISDRQTGVDQSVTCWYRLRCVLGVDNKHTHARQARTHRLSAVCPDRWREEDALLYERV